MHILQGSLFACLVTLALAEPPVGNQYLPPSTTGGGYNYPAPPVPFPPPSQPTPRPPPAPRPPTNTYGPPSAPPKPTYGPPPTNGQSTNTNYETAHLNMPHVPGMPYDFNYAVKDDYYGTDYSHNAVSDGDQVKGEYRVQLPDGRLQIVSYVADWATGFHADVRYEGQASYPETNKGGYPAAGPPANSYGPPSQGY